MNIRSNRRVFAAAALALVAQLAAGCRGGGETKGNEGAAQKPATTSAAGTGTAATPAAPPPTAIQLPAPAVPNAAEAKKYAGAKITFYGDSVGIMAELDKVMAKRFQDDTGIEVRVVPRPKEATETYAAYQRMFQGQSADVDVMTVDVIWPGAFAQNLVDLGPKLGEAAKGHVQTLIENSTVDGKLVAMPWFTDFGILYYRTDLLQKYGFAKAPETWDELEAQAKKILEGEKATNAALTGFVWQGKAYEGLTCNALEWVYSHGGGTLVDDKKITVNNPQAAKALTRARGWVGGISPAGVTGYTEEEVRNVFQTGNAVFMRNWPYAYALGNDEKSAIKGKFDVAPLPHEPGQKSAGTAGGWNLAVSKYSKSPDAAIELVRYLASPEGQRYRAIVGSVVPTVTAMQADAEVAKKIPFLEKVRGGLEVVPRPSRSTGTRYNEASIAFFQGVSQVLSGKEASAVLPGVEQRMTRTLEQ
ncbi:ABC transporter substrate-binding protein [Polyangium aurulentum]|uniref:ABC transporter substrate-binding protein n=1 Tax=Polyangium aurulentum TaxID=2567896 RepID=UPI0010AE2F93|nr:ABC transporter substrate-binding protein [Polyangium aurulentum]UQA56162.1 ABC transporter substrate-binding protein [Polyangium aurulentum]